MRLSTTQLNGRIQMATVMAQSSLKGSLLMPHFQMNGMIWMAMDGETTKMIAPSLC